MLSHSAGALASRLTDRQARVAQQRCVMLATHAWDEGQVASQAGLDGYTGPARAARGFRLLKAPQCLASSLSRKKPERIMALLLVMTGWLLVSAALDYRIRTALQEQGATCPDQQGRRIPTPTTRWGFHYCVGIPGLSIPGQERMILHLTDEHQPLLARLGKRYAWFDRYKCIQIRAPMRKVG